MGSVGLHQTFSSKTTKDWPAVTGRADLPGKQHDGMVPPLDILKPESQSQFEAEKESHITVEETPIIQEDVSATFQHTPNLDILGQINPELAYAIMAEQETYRSSLKQRLQVLYEDLIGKPWDILNPTALQSLKTEDLELECRKCGLKIPNNKQELANELRFVVMQNEILEHKGQFQNTDDRQEVERIYKEIFEVYEQKDESQSSGKEKEKHGPAATFEQITKSRFQYKQIFTAEEVANMLLKAKMEEVTIMDLSGRCQWADFFVIATGRSLRHIYAAAYAVFYTLKQKCKEVAPGQKPRVEGQNGLGWLLVDCGSVIVHCFMPQDREYYNLEELWREEANDIYSIQLPEEEKIMTIDTIQSTVQQIEAGNEE